MKKNESFAWYEPQWWFWSGINNPHSRHSSGASGIFTHPLILALYLSPFSENLGKRDMFLSYLHHQNQIQIWMCRGSQQYKTECQKVRREERNERDCVGEPVNVGRGAEGTSVQAADLAKHFESGKHLEPPGKMGEVWMRGCIYFTFAFRPTCPLGWPIPPGAEGLCCELNLSHVFGVASHNSSPGRAVGTQPKGCQRNVCKYEPALSK